MDNTAIHWLQHCNSWFGFTEPAKFVQHRDGGFFASVATDEQIHSVIQNGLRAPSKGLAPWATGGAA